MTKNRRLQKRRIRRVRSAHGIEFLARRIQLKAYYQYDTQHADMPRRSKCRLDTALISLRD